MTRDWDHPRPPGMRPYRGDDQVAPRHACANRRRLRPRDPVRLTDAHDRMCLAFWCVVGALALAIGYVWLQLAVPLSRPSRDVELRPAPAVAIHAAGAPLCAAPRACP